MTFELGFTEQIPKILEDIRNTFGLFEKHYLKENEPKKPRNIFRTVNR